jgi:hypothetical protein
MHTSNSLKLSLVWPTELWVIEVVPATTELKKRNNKTDGSQGEWAYKFLSHEDTY